MLKGIDVSDWQGPINWGAVASSGRRFAFTKATEGVYFVAPSVAFNWKGIKDAGLVRGAYHFARPGVSSASEEAQHFLATIGQPSEGDLLALDLEDGDGNLLLWALEWLSTIKATTGITPILYSSADFMRSHGLTKEALALVKFPLWIWHSLDEVPPLAPYPWKSAEFWQWTWEGSCPGVWGTVDEDFFLGDEVELQELGHKSTLEEYMPTLVDTMNLIWQAASEGQAHPEATDAMKAILERIKQEGIVVQKKLIGLQ